MAKQIHTSNGVVIEYSSDDVSYTPVACPRAYSLPSSTRAVIDATCLDSTTFEGLGGQFSESNASFTVLYDPADAETAALRTMLADKSLNHWRWTFDNGVEQALLKVQARVTGIELQGGDANSVQEMVVTLTPQGDITEAAAP